MIATKLKVPLWGLNYRNVKFYDACFDFSEKMPLYIVKSVYLKINVLISQPKHVVGTHKNGFNETLF